LPATPLKLDLENSFSNSDSESSVPLSPLYPERAVRPLEPRRSKLGKSQRGDVKSTKESWIGKIQQASSRSIVISEILDSRTKDLVSVAQISDYVLSNELVSMALAMVSEDQQINKVLDELFDEQVRTVGRFVSFQTIVAGSDCSQLFFECVQSCNCSAGFPAYRMAGF
jgi:hypothetical protein